MIPTLLTVAMSASVACTNANYDTDKGDIQAEDDLQALSIYLAK